MENKKSRSYNSLIRQKQAEETRERIASAADKLIKAGGYGQTTISSIAREAGVATQTVYAIFGSKQGILMYLLKRTMRANVTEDISSARAAQQDTDFPHRVVRISRARNKRQCATMASLGGFEMLYPELHALVLEGDAYRRELIEEDVSALEPEVRSRLFPDNKQKERKLDLLWALTDGSLYHHLVVRAGWAPELFEKTLAQLMAFIMRELKVE